MRRRLTGSIALALSVVLLSLMSSDSTTHAQPSEKYVWDTGIVAVGLKQVLRVNAGMNACMCDGSVKFRRISYTQTVPDAEGVTKLELNSVFVTNVVPLMPGEGVLYVAGEAGVYRVMVLSNTRNPQVNASITDTETGQIDVIIAPVLLP
jgi:hypothetical protein